MTGVGHPLWQYTTFASFVVAPLCSYLQTFIFPSVPAVTMTTDINNCLFNPPSLSAAEPEVAAGDQAPPGAPVADVADAEGGQNAEGDSGGDPDAAEAEGTAEEGADPEGADDGLSDTTPDPLPMRDPSEVVEDTLDPATVEEPTYSNENMDSATWTTQDIAEKSKLVKTFVSLEGHRCHVDTLEWDEQLTRGQITHPPGGGHQDHPTVRGRFRALCHGPSHSPGQWKYVYGGREGRSEISSPKKFHVLFIMLPPHAACNKNAL